jgi:hypothetical protein
VVKVGQYFVVFQMFEYVLTNYVFEYLTGYTS